MTTRTDRLQVIFEVGGDGKLKAALADIGKDGAKAAEGLDKASASHDRMLASAKRAGAVMGGAIVAGIGLMIKNTIEAERVDAQLEARLKSTAGAAGMTKQALDDLATATARKTTFDDEAVKSAEAMLLTFTKIHADVFPKAIDAITDMATAMGTDLETASVQVGKALNDPIQGVSALTRVGVQFSEAQKEVIKSLVETGQTAAAQGVILRELETQFGGAAEAARNTFGGALAALKNTLMDLTEGQGGSLNGAKEAVEDLNSALADPATKQNAADLTAALFKIADWGVTAGRAFTQFGKGLGAMLAELGNQADATLSIWKQIGTLGMADGTIRGAMQQSAAGRKEFWRQMDDMVLQNHGMTRDSYNKQFAAQWDVGIPGIAKPSTFPQEGFNFAADMAGRGKMPASPARPTGNGGAGGGGSGRAKAAEIDVEAEARKRLTQAIVDQITQNEREIALMGIDKDRREELTALYEVQHGEMAKATQAEKDAYVESAKALDLARESNAERERQIELDERRAEATRQAQDALQGILADQEFELKLLGLSNEQRALEIAQRQAGAAFTPDQANQFLANENALKEAQMALGYADDMKSVTKSFLMDMSKDAAGTFRNIGDYWEDLVDRMLSRWLDAGLDGLFSGQGFSGFSGGFGGGGGSGGGFWGMLGGLFSGGGSSGFAASANGVSGADFASIFESGAFGLAQGGSARKGQLYEVAEFNRPEVFKANGRTWLIPGSNGYVQPMGDGMSGGMGGGANVHHATYNFDFRGTDHHRASTPDQISQRIDERVRRTGRNR